MVHTEVVISNGPTGVARRASPARASSNIRPLADGETARTCLVCVTALRIPANVRVFRCSECGTINELRSPPSSVTKVESAPLQQGEVFAFEAGIRHHRNWPEHVKSELLLATRAHHAFSSLLCLDRSFTAHGSLDEPLDIDIVERFYALMSKDERALRVFVADLKALIARPGVYLDSQDPDPFWRWAVVIAKSPLLLQKSEVMMSDDRKELLARFFGLVASMPGRQQHRLCRYWARNAGACLPQLVAAGNALLAQRIATCRELNEHAYMQDWRVSAIVRLLSLCFVANKRAIEHGLPGTLPIDAFYCTAIDGMGASAIVQDFEVFKRIPRLLKDGSLPPLVFCAYPHLLSMGIKQALLSYESRRAMASSARSALRSTMSGNSESPVLTLRVRRSHVVQDSLEQLFANRAQLKKPLRIMFLGEEGIDAGGLLKEWLLILSSELFRPHYGMFIPADDSQFCWFNEHAPSHETEAEYYLVGAVCGLAVYSASPIEIPLPLAAFKMLLKGTPNFQDLKILHPSLAHGLEMLLTYEGDVEETFCRTFVAESDVFGETKETELIPGGRNVAVTSENRQDFVDLLLQHTFSAAKRQFSAFAKGFLQVCGGNALSLFSAHELELLVRGQEATALDIAQLQACAQLEGWPGGPNDPTIQLFWKYLGALSPTEQRKVLAFICGSGRLPATGALKLRLTCGGRSTQRLPQSHTCFNQLVLPRYKTLAEMSRGLKMAYEESQGFGLR